MGLAQETYSNKKKAFPKTHLYKSSVTSSVVFFKIPGLVALMQRVVQFRGGRRRPTDGDLRGAGTHHRGRGRGVRGGRTAGGQGALRVPKIQRQTAGKQTVWT